MPVGLPQAGYNFNRQLLRFVPTGNSTQVSLKLVLERVLTANTSFCVGFDMNWLRLILAFIFGDQDTETPLQSLAVRRDGRFVPVNMKQNGLLARIEMGVRWLKQRLRSEDPIGLGDSIPFYHCLSDTEQDPDSVGQSRRPVGE